MKVSFSKTLEVGAPVAESPVIEIQATPVIPIVEPAVESVTTIGTPSGPVEAVMVDSTPVSQIPTAPAVNGAVAIIPNTPTAVIQSDSPGQYNADDIGFDDIRLPRINIVHNVGDLSVVFNPGEIVLNQSAVIHEPANVDKKKAGNPPLVLAVLGFKKIQFTEKVAGGKMGALLNTESEVVAHGGTLDYNEWKRSEGKLKRFQKLATALLLVQKPEHYNDPDEATFPYECEGRRYALALFSMKGTAFTNAAKHIFTLRKMRQLAKQPSDYPLQFWTLTTKLAEYDGTWSHIPVLKQGPRTTEVFLSFAKDILGLSR